MASGFTLAILPSLDTCGEGTACALLGGLVSGELGGCVSGELVPF